MPRAIVLLRGINLGAHNRVSMPALRELLSEAGFEDVCTYVQSGNVVLSSKLKPAQLEAACEELLDDRLGLKVPVVARTAKELAAVVARNPLRDVAADPKRYQVSFLRHKLAADRVRELERLAQGEEQLVADGRELYAWHPSGVARSKLWARLGAAGLGVTATTRNWTTVQTLAAMAAA